MKIYFDFETQKEVENRVAMRLFIPVRAKVPDESGDYPVKTIKEIAEKYRQLSVYAFHLNQPMKNYFVCPIQFSSSEKWDNWYISRRPK